MEKIVQNNMEKADQNKSVQKETIEQLWKNALQKRRKIMGKIYDTEKEECYLANTESVPAVRFCAFDEFSFVNAAFSTRFGGISKGFLSQLNLGFQRGDDDKTVARNYTLFCNSIGVSPENLVLSDQVHDTKLQYVTQEDACNGTIQKKLKGIDGIYTDQKNICLATSYADCVPLFFVDPVKKVIASSHSGWKGTVGKIGQKTIQTLEETFQSDRKDIIAVIGPSICQECYEVSRDVIDLFAEAYTAEQMKQIAYCSNREEEKYQLDLWAANYIQFEEAGLLPKNIHVSGICTCCNQELFFSHRASHGKRGNLNGFLSLC
ncbi:MAG: peptidoglycan editing factor PgeF [Butyribacter sp.]|nr:peptidoglycan editing factor PgeF [bacterium]MDY3853484.1 peptidoglycan editing factor PgeF [Butyribacter sp.]